MLVSAQNRKVSWLLAVTLAAPVLLLAKVVQAQPGEMQGMSGQGMGGMCQCPMMNMGSGWRMAGMILTGLLTLAAIATLVALTIFLVRRSRPRPAGAG